MNPKKINQALSSSYYLMFKNHSIRKKKIKRNALIKDVISKGIKDVKDVILAKTKTFYFDVNKQLLLI